ncbi:MAG: peptidoglycan editing factor PgeF [Proteobacteria bacterium]|nr:peptidoglycan editing factor PgeF [Pseudomonadota bacterium]
MTTPLPVQITEPALAEMPGIRHAFFTRQGGVSQGVYASLNMGYGSDDDREAISENRRLAMAAFDLPASALNTAYQIHGTEVAMADRDWNLTGAPHADAMVTDRPGIAIGILTADCVPVLFAGEAPDGRKIIGGAHAGWRGAVTGVLDSTVVAMENLGAARDTIRAAIGPCIGVKSYEVGPEFPKPFVDQDRQNARFFRPGIRKGHPMFNIAGYVENRLAALFVGQVGRIDADTCADEDRFFSYRRKTLTGEVDYGRQLSAITIEA